MATVTTWKASDPPDAPDLHIEATEGVPANLGGAGDGWESRSRERFGVEAKKIVDAMYESLPGGTIDAIFGELCHRNASIFHVTHRR